MSPSPPGQWAQHVSAHIPPLLEVPCHIGKISGLPTTSYLADNRTRVSGRFRLATSPMTRLHTHLHVHRRQRRISQQELAYLLGKKNASSISRFELGKRDPSLAATFACQILFDVSPSDLFPKLFTEVEDAVLRRAFVLHERLKRHPSTTTQTKLKLLNGVLTRAKHRITKKEL
jgi:transcriptional regulator with XRE-family HTH domain